ncbi:MAG: hypothetical protein ACXV2C_01155 [Candidatus Bathyarchaeia archaeon]
MPDNERDERIAALIGYAVNKNPIEFQQTFTDIVTDRLAQAVDDRKVEVAQTIFNEPPEEETTETPEEDVVADEPEEEETNDQES